MKIRLIISFLFLVTSLQLQAQKFSISGTVVNEENSVPIIGATVALMMPADSIIITGEVTDLDGYFKLKEVKEGSYIIKISYLGFETLYKNVNSEADLNLGTIYINEASQILEEVVIEAEVVTGGQRGDTVSFNAAAFTTLNDATTQDLIAKMPGIVIQDGQVQAEGETIQRILVDGKEFFGTDVNTALQSLPAEIVKSIEIFDRRSERARLSGFDDGSEEKTINIVTKPNRKVGQFGKMTAGYGNDDRYQAGASINFFNNEQRIAVTGVSNNINATSFSADPNSQGEERTQDGVINTNNINVQYSNNWSDIIELSGSYGFSDRVNRADGLLFREYIIPSQIDQFYEEENASSRQNQDHRFNMRMVYNMTDRDKLIFIPRVSIKNDISDYEFLGKTSEVESPINQTNNISSGNNQDNDYFADLLYNHKFVKIGRSLTTEINAGYHTNNDIASRLAENIFYLENGIEIQDLNQSILRDRRGLNYEVGASFTEPAGRKGMFELEYQIRNRENRSDLLNYNIFDEIPGEVSREVLDTSLSNVFRNDYLTNEVELGYQFQGTRLNLQTELEYQRADLWNNQIFPTETVIERTFQSLNPTVRMDYRFSENRNLEVNYYTWTREPSVGQLQEVVDNSNPLRLRIGNPNLGQEYNQRIRARYKFRNPSKETSFYMGMDARIVNNFITNTTVIANEPIIINENITIANGGQIIQPQNVSGNWSVRSFVNFGRPVPMIKSNFNIWTGIGYRQLPGVINDQKSFNNSTDLRLGVNLSSNISENVDFNISTRSNYSFVKNSLKPEIDNNFFRHTTQVRFNAILWKGIVLRTDARHQIFTGLAEGVDNSFLLVNMSIGKKILKNERGELAFRVYDLFGQNNNVDRNVTELYIEDVERTVLQRYFMLSFTYNLRRFSSGSSIDDFKLESGEEDGRRRNYRR